MDYSPSRDKLSISPSRDKLFACTLQRPGMCTGINTIRFQSQNLSNLMVSQVTLNDLTQCLTDWCTISLWCCHTSSRPRCHVACSGTHWQRRKLLPMRACLYGSAVGLEADVHWSGDLPTVHPSHVKTHLYSWLWTWPEGGYPPNQRSRWKHAFWRY